MQSAVREYSEQLEGDAIVKRHLDDLFKALLEQNLLRIIKPYSKVQVAHLATLIALDAATVEREISQMILDKKVAGALPCPALAGSGRCDCAAIVCGSLMLARACAGILDQGTGCLEVFEEVAENQAYPAAMDVIQNMGTVVDALFDRSRRLVA